MKNQNQTKSTLIDECSNLRQQVRDLQRLINSYNHPEHSDNPPIGHLRVMLENTQEAIKVIQDDRLKFVNRKSAEIYGYSCKEMTGKHMLDMIHPDDHEKVTRNHNNRKKGEAVPPYPYRIIDKQGNVKWIEVSAILTSWEGRPAVITFITDISRRVDAEEELKRSKRQLADIIEFLPDATFAIDCEGTVIIWNKRIEEMTGIRAEDMIGKGNFEYALPFYGKRRPILIDLVLKPDIFLEKKYSILKREENSLYAQMGGYLKNGIFHWLRARASTVYDHNENIIGAIESIRDMTDFKKTENELKEKSTNLEEANTALRVLLKHRENDKSEMEDRIARNIRELVLPYLGKLKSTNLNSTQTSLIAITETYLDEIISPFLLKMERKHPELTPREVQIASLVKNGYTTKEISEILNIETTTINNHRRRLRKKMCLCGKDKNLRSYLLSFPESSHTNA